MELIPRVFLISHDKNEYTYWVSYEYKIGWVIVLGTKTSGMFLTNKHLFDYMGEDTLVFTTPSDALMGWQKYIEARPIYKIVSLS